MVCLGFAASHEYSIIFRVTTVEVWFTMVSCTEFFQWDQPTAEVEVSVTSPMFINV